MSTMSKQRVKLLGILLLCFCLAFVTGFGAHQFWERLGGTNQASPLGVFWETWDRIEVYFYGELPTPQERTYGAIHEALTLLNDPYTVFVEPQPRELERDRMRGSFGGIGVTLWRDSEGRMILSPHPDSPAARAGVIEGDVLLALDGADIVGETTVDDAIVLLHGEVGTLVTLTISRPPTTREEIKVPSVTWRVLDQATEVGYIRVESFTERTGDEVATAAQELRAAGTTGLVLDLRDNYGGLIEPAVTVASQFLRDGVVLYETGRNSEERALQVQSGGAATDVPLVVLVNSGTASAAEIVAGALQDHDRAFLIGEPTFGKGSVQLIYEISDGSSLHVTSAIWLTPNRNRIEGKGLIPNVYIERGDGPQDEQLERAVEHLR